MSKDIDQADADVEQDAGERRDFDDGLAHGDFGGGAQVIDSAVEKRVVRKYVAESILSIFSTS